MRTVPLWIPTAIPAGLIVTFCTPGTAPPLAGSVSQEVDSEAVHVAPAGPPTCKSRVWAGAFAGRTTLSFLGSISNGATRNDHTSPLVLPEKATTSTRQK
jgi:hypothetical protein